MARISIEKPHRRVPLIYLAFLEKFLVYWCTLKGKFKIQETKRKGVELNSTKFQKLTSTFYQNKSKGPLLFY